jgi:hypothetical protein
MRAVPVDRLERPLVRDQIRRSVDAISSGSEFVVGEEGHQRLEVAAAGRPEDNLLAGGQSDRRRELHWSSFGDR